MKAILTFHSIDNTNSILSYSPMLFAQLLESLYKANIPILHLDELLKPTTQQGITLTFDDGMHSVLANALPVLRNYAVPAHIFITTDAVDNNQLWPKQSSTPGFKMLTWDHIEQLHNANISIDAHTQTHPDMRKLTKEQIIEECEQSNEHIERQIGHKPRFFAYPFGYHNLHIRNYARDTYKASVTTELRYLSPQEDLAALPRLDSYYLKFPWLLNHLNNPITRGYLQLRWLLRTLRGSHCTATYDN